MKTDGKLNKTSSRLIAWFTLRRAWLIYAIALVAYVASVLLSHNALLISLGTTVMTIFVLFLIMMQSNKEVRLGLEKEAKTFEESLKLVTSELKKVSEATLKSAGSISRVEAGISSMAGKTTELVSIEQERENERIGLLKPRIFASLFINSWGWFGIYKHYYISISNIGGDARDLILYFPRAGIKMQSSFQSLKRGPPWNIDYGDVAVFKIANPLNVEISLYDMEGRNYYGSGVINSDKGEISEILLRRQQVL